MADCKVIYDMETTHLSHMELCEDTAAPEARRSVAHPSDLAELLNESLGQKSAAPEENRGAVDLGEGTDEKASGGPGISSGCVTCEDEEEDGHTELLGSRQPATFEDADRGFVAEIPKGLKKCSLGRSSINCTEILTEECSVGGTWRPVHHAEAQEPSRETERQAKEEIGAGAPSTKGTVACRRFTAGGSTRIVRLTLGAAHVRDGIEWSFEEGGGVRIRRVNREVLGDNEAIKTKFLLLDMKLGCVVSSLKWRFGEKGGAWIKQLGKDFPHGLQLKHEELQVGDRLVAINEQCVWDLGKSDIERVWRSEQVKAKPRVLCLEFASAEELQPGHLLVSVNGHPCSRQRITQLLNAEGHLELAFAALLG